MLSTELGNYSIFCKTQPVATEIPKPSLWNASLCLSRRGCYSISNNNKPEEAVISWACVSGLWHSVIAPAAGSTIKSFLLSGQFHGQIHLVILQCWSWDLRRNSSPMGMGSSQALARSWCQASQPRLPPVFAKSLPGGLNCSVPTAAMTATCQHRCCARMGAGGGEDMGAPSAKHNARKDRRMSLLWPAVPELQGTSGL